MLCQIFKSTLLPVACRCMRRFLCITEHGKFKVLSIYILSWSPVHKNVICMFVMRNRPLGKMFKLFKQMCIWRYLFCFYAILFFTRRKPNRLNNHVPYYTVQRWITLTFQRLLLVLKYCFDAG